MSKAARFHKIPSELQERPQWVCWKLEQRKGKSTKIPYDPATGKRASSTDPQTWRCFSDAVTTFNNGDYSGIGYVFAQNDPFTGVDLDHVRDPQSKKVQSWARDLVKRFNSYAELSQSGTGAHIIIRGKLNGTRRRKGDVEIYDQGRYFVMTGMQLAGTPGRVEERQAVLDEVCKEYLAPEPELPATLCALPSSDAEIIEKARNALNGEVFSQLWRGDWKSIHSSQSEADAALLSFLRFWTGGDKARAFALFSRSGLNRPKWQREDYREKTWSAINRGDVYSPPAAASVGQVSSKLPPVKNRAPSVDIEEAATYQAFPIDSLPEPYRSLVLHGSRSIGCAPALIALPLLAATAGAIGNTRRIQLKQGWTEPSILWAVTVALSGDRKSPAFDLAFDGMMQIDERAYASYRAAQEEYNAALQDWKDSGSTGRKPEPPVPTRFIVRDITVEGLALVLSENSRGVTLARDELAAWVGGFDRYQGGRGEESAHWLEMYRAGKVTVDRKTGDRKTVHVPRAAVSISGTIQPATLTRVLEQRHFENGLAARLLLAWPPQQLRQWNESEIDKGLIDPARVVFDRLTGLTADTDQFGNLVPIDLQLSPEGKSLWIQFYNAHGAEMQRLGDERLMSAWSKLEGTTARLALLIHCVRQTAGDETLLNVDQVDQRSIAAAIHLTDWFKNETRRIYARMIESADSRDARKVYEYALDHGGARVRDMRRAGLCRGDSERIKDMLKMLCSSGYGHMRNDEPTDKGGRPTQTFIPIAETAITAETPTCKPITPLPKPSKLTKPPNEGEVLAVPAVLATSGKPSDEVLAVPAVLAEDPGTETEEGVL